MVLGQGGGALLVAGGPVGRGGVCAGGGILLESPRGVGEYTSSPLHTYRAGVGIIFPA